MRHFARRVRRRLRRGERFWRHPSIWVPAPRSVIEPEAAGLDTDSLRMPETFAGLSAPPVFICGCARSGTTWTFDLFDRHPQVSAICESWILSQTHGVTSILSQPYWDLAERAAWAERVNVPFGAIQLLPYGEMVSDIRDLVATWLTRNLSPQHRYLVSKEPIDVRAAAILFPKARFIHILRDGRDVALSMKRASESWDPTMGVGSPMEIRAETWRRQVENIRSHRSSLEGRYLEVRYEDMRADVRGAMRSIFEFASIDYDEDLLDEIAGSTHLASYDESVRRSGFRGGGENRSWQGDFSGRDAWGFQRAAGELLRELGYETDPRWWLSQLPPARYRAAFLRSLKSVRPARA
jgi:hypothetical protein